MTIKRYLSDPHTMAGNAVVIHTGEDASGFFAVLDQTWFYPQHRDQRSDRGTVGGIRVVNVEQTREGADVHHYLAPGSRLHVGARVRITVNQRIRDENARLHTAAHLIAGLVEQSFTSLEARETHLWPGQSSIDFTGKPGADPEPFSRAVQALVDFAVRASWQVRVHEDPSGSRIAQIHDLPSKPCTGPHCSSLVDLQSVIIRGVETRKDVDTRIRFDVVTLADMSPDWFYPNDACSPG